MKEETKDVNLAKNEMDLAKNEIRKKEWGDGR